MLRVLNGDPKYIPGYWTTEAVAFATDAFVFLDLLGERDPPVAAHLRACTVSPEVYLQKWFCVLCIQNLPFALAFPFLEGFLAHGHRWLFQFALAAHSHLRGPLLATTRPDVILGILHFDPKHLAAASVSVTAALLDEVRAVDVDDIDFAARRTAAYETHLQARLERARAQQAAAEEVSDIEDDDDEEDAAP
eukprot:TRINITY_DN7186_c0_g1_i1.p1 TRINITY_DN7186_c0_g1~~TRINITY_DN7186_c0_g1_i1.p1  ORF type:complete len:192 (+),score=89.57 TRINITY_DN7186_c0_g1_i1:256-831(+)